MFVPRQTFYMIWHQILLVQYVQLINILTTNVMEKRLYIIMQTLMQYIQFLPTRHQTGTSKKTSNSFKTLALQERQPQPIVVGDGLDNDGE